MLFSLKSTTAMNENIVPEHCTRMVFYEMYVNFIRVTADELSDFPFEQ